MSRIAIMQGRLVPPEGGRFQSFPRERWREEFAFAAQANLDAIEWIYDQFGENVNPLASDEGIEEIRLLSRRHQVSVVSVCADYFMDRPIPRASDHDLEEILDRLTWLLTRCAGLGIERMVLPFVDQSRIENADEATRVVEALKATLPAAEASGVELHLETSLAPDEFAALLDRLPHKQIKANYDSGNSASLGYDPIEEFAAYGSRIGSVHIKDRVRGGGTVPLGTGHANLRAVVDSLQRVGYSGDFVLQVARGEPGEEVAWTRKNVEYVVAMLGLTERRYARSPR